MVCKELESCALQRRLQTDHPCSHDEEITNVMQTGDQMLKFRYSTIIWHSILCYTSQSFLFQAASVIGSGVYKLIVFKFARAVTASILRQHRKSMQQNRELSEKATATQVHRKGPRTAYPIC